MNRRSTLLRVCGILLILNLCFIWGNSLLPAAYSQALSDWVLKLLPVSGTAAPVPMGGSGLLRKIAHFTEFMVLGFLLNWRHLLLGRRGWQSLLWAALAACIDETIQLFVPGRGPGLPDVGIDVCGAAAGMILLQTGYHFWKRKHFK